MSMNVSKRVGGRRRRKSFRFLSELYTYLYTLMGEREGEERRGKGGGGGERGSSEEVTD